MSTFRNKFDVLETSLLFSRKITFKLGNFFLQQNITILHSLLYELLRVGVGHGAVSRRIRSSNGAFKPYVATSLGKELHCDFCVSRALTSGSSI